jgi:hypothetical protein
VHFKHSVPSPTFQNLSQTDGHHALSQSRGNPSRRCNLPSLCRSISGKINLNRIVPCGRSLTPSKSCHPPRHLGFPEPPCTADSVQGRPALSSPAFPTASPPTKKSIREYFHEKIPSEGIKYTKRRKHKRKKDGEREERIGYLVQAAQGLWKAADPQHDASEEISTGIDTSILYSIHIAHHVRMSLKLISEETKQGIGQLTPAFEKTAADLSLDV